MNFRERALQAWQEKQEKQKAEEEQHQKILGERAALAWLEQFGFEPDEVHGPVVVVGGIALRHIDRQDGYVVNSFAVVGDCPKCGEETRSPYCVSLADIGQQLVEFEPDYIHRCPTQGRHLGRRASEPND